MRPTNWARKRHNTRLRGKDYGDGADMVASGPEGRLVRPLRARNHDMAVGKSRPLGAVALELLLGIGGRPLGPPGSGAKRALNPGQQRRLDAFAARVTDEQWRRRADVEGGEGERDVPSDGLVPGDEGGDSEYKGPLGGGVPSDTCEPDGEAGPLPTGDEHSGGSIGNSV